VSDGELHTVVVSGTIEFSADSKYILSTAAERLKLIDAASGDEVYRFNEEISHSMSGHFSEDGKYIFLTRNVKNLRGTDPYDSVTLIWETESHRLLYRLSGQGWDMSSVVFSPDNKYIATVSGKVQLWEASSGKLLRSMDRGEVCFSPDSKYMAVTGKRAVQVFGVEGNNILSELKGRSNSLTRAVFHPDGKLVLTLTNEKIARLWDFNKGEIIKTFEESSVIKDAEFSKDGISLLMITEDGIAKVKDIASGQDAFTLKQDGINTACYNNNGRLIITTSDTIVNTWDATTGKKLFMMHEAYTISDAAISASGKYAYYIFGGSAVGVLDFTTGRIFKDYLGAEAVGSCEFSPDNKYIFILGEKGTARLFETSSGKMVEQLSEGSKTEYGVSRIGGYYYENLWQSRFRHFSEDGNFLIFRKHFDSYAVVRSMNDLKVIDSIFINSGLINNAFFVPHSGYLVTGSTDDTIRIWKLEKKKFRQFKKFAGNGFEISPDGKRLLLINNVQLNFYDLQTQQLRFKALGVNENDYFIQLADKPYYAASKNASTTLTFRLGDQFLSFDQFDLEYNRPDKILSALGSNDTALIRAYRNAYYKRINKLGLDTISFKEGFSIPELKIQNRDSIRYEQKDGLLKLHLLGKSTTVLDRINVWVNEVPVFGKRGIDLHHRSKKNIDTTISITLSNGKNIIEASVTNSNQKESYRSPLVVEYTDDKLQKEMLHFIGIGINRFADSKHNLQYCNKDISDLALNLKIKYGNSMSIDTLFNENVTISNIKALKQKLMHTKENDKVIIAYSGHGLLSKNYDYYLSTYAVNFEKPEENGLPYDALENLLDSIPARKKLMLIDACHSGEVDKEEALAMNKMADSMGLSRGSELLVYDTTQRFGLNNSFELMQSLFVNVGKSTGATIIAAAAGNQFAQERGNLKNGVFTYCILEAMKDHPTMKISELKKNVGERVEQLTHGMQKPTSRNETIAVDWEVW
jgi:WD40 repeat protein